MEMGKKVYLSIGSEKNLKITTQDDLDIFSIMSVAGFGGKH